MLRDNKGRFVHGHKPIPCRCSITGRFISKKESMYVRVRGEVDRFLTGGGGCGL